MILLGSIVASLFCGIASCSEASKALDLAPPMKRVPLRISISPDSSKLTVGDTVVLHATVLDSLGHQLADSVETWSSSDTSVVRVSPTGVVTALTAGEVTVTAQLKDTTQAAKIWISDTAKASDHTGAPSSMLPAPVGSLTSVEMMPVVAATQLRNGLGFNVDPSQLWQLQAAHDAGATEVRMQFDWPSVERSAGQLALPKQFEDALANSVQLGLEPLIVAAYGPGGPSLPTLTLASPAVPGDTSIRVAERGTLAQVVLGSAFIIGADGQQLVSQSYASYFGGLVTNADQQTGQIFLAAPVSRALSIGTQVKIVNRLYKLAGTGPNDPSVQAYIRYVQFLAGRIASYGVAGRVEIWNEPPWEGDRWDGGAPCFFARAAQRVGCVDYNFSFALALMATTPPGRVRYNWGGTHKTGFASVLAGGNIGIPATRTRDEILNSVASESFHPYGASPEHHAWDPQCLAQSGSNPFPCSLPGTDATSNFKWARKLAEDHLSTYGWTIEQNITETGVLTSNQAAKTRFILRTFITYHALGFQRINFFKLADGSASTSNYGFMDAGLHTAYPVYNALKAFLGDLDALETPTALPATTSLPSVVSYQGTWPLMVVPIVGIRASTAGTSVLLVLWQRTYPSGGGQFDTIISPGPGQANVKLPTGLHPTGAWSLTDRSPSKFQVQADGTISINVTDNPTVLQLDP